MDIVVQIESRQGWDVLRYIGPINEDAEVQLAQVLPRLGQKVIVNFKQVTSVNSCGVRTWVNFMRDASKGREFQFEECTPEIVMQMNMIPSFRGSANVRSVFGAYICEGCGHEGNVLFEVGKNLPTTASDEIAPPKCPKCSSDMESAELEDEFFAFVDAA